MDFRSPGAVNLREVFDVSYAVHRQEEEGKRRKNFKQGYRGANAINSLNALDEDDFVEEEDEYEAVSAPYNPSEQNLPAKLPKSQANDVAAMEKQMRNTSLSHAAQQRQQAVPPPAAAAAPRGRERPEEKGYGQHSAAVAAAARKQVKQRGAFELSLDNATMLGRRAKKPAGEPTALSQQMTVGGS